MKTWPNLVMMVAMLIAIVLTYCTNNEYNEAIILLALAIVGIVMTLINFKTGNYMKRKDRIYGFIFLIFVICTSIYIIFNKLI